MAATGESRRFRANPIELMIFGAVSLIFAGSLYNLLYGDRDFHAAALSHTAASPLGKARAPASVGTQAFLSMELACDASPERQTTASKIRLTGSLCGLSGDTSTLVKSSITNVSNKFSATVFTDVNAGKFSTDYIPLVPGKNSIQVEFQYKDGKSFTQEIGIIKQ